MGTQLIPPGSSTVSGAPPTHIRNEEGEDDWVPVKSCINEINGLKSTRILNRQKCNKISLGIKASLKAGDGKPEISHAAGSGQLVPPSPGPSVARPAC